MSNDYFGNNMDLEIKILAVKYIVRLIKKKKSGHSKTSQPNSFFTKNANTNGLNPMVIGRAYQNTLSLLIDTR